MYSVEDNRFLIYWVAPFGNLRVNALSSSPKLIAGIASFIACWCQGIHQQPLLAWPKKFDSKQYNFSYVFCWYCYQRFCQLFLERIPQAPIFVSDDVHCCTFSLKMLSTLSSCLDKMQFTAYCFINNLRYFFTTQKFTLFIFKMLPS